VTAITYMAILVFRLLKLPYFRAFLFSLEFSELSTLLLSKPRDPVL
jgi:hypothetical protein